MAGRFVVGAGLDGADARFAAPVVLDGDAFNVRLARVAVGVAIGA